VAPGFKEAVDYTGRGFTEIRRIVCTTNATESVNARIRRAVKAHGHFPNEQAALKCVFMAIMSLDPTGKGQAR
jgi:transposase-like protein